MRNKILIGLFSLTLAFGFLYVFYFRIVVQQVIKQIPNPVPSYEIFCQPGLKTCNGVLSNTIESSEQYLKLGMMIRSLPSDWKVNIQLDGFGGDMDSVYYFYNTIKKSEAKVTLEVVGPVYSAHAFLAMAGDSLEIDDLAFFMFHKPAIYNPETKEFELSNTICRIAKGKDRGQPQEGKCIERMKANDKMYDKFFEEKVKPFLTKEELIKYEIGEDVYISGEEIKRRLTGAK